MPQDTTIVTKPSIASTPLWDSIGQALWPPFVVASLLAFGIVASLAALVYAVKTRRTPAALAQAMGGGLIGSSAIAAIGTNISGIGLSLTWLQAGIVAGGGFLFGVLFWALAGIIAFEKRFLRVYENRFGKLMGVRLWIQLWTDFSSFTNFASTLTRVTSADRVWDEFTCALLHVQRTYPSLPAGTDLLARGLRSVAGPASHADHRAQAVEVIDKLLHPLIEALSSRLSFSALNFTVWRVSDDGQKLEHLASFPVEPGHRQGVGWKEDLKIWHDGDKLLESGSLAGEAAIMHRFRIADCERFEQMSSRWPKRTAGTKYHEVGAMPVPCEEHEGSPWAVVCVEVREGSLPVKSQAVGTLLALFSQAVHATEPLAKRKSIADCQAEVAIRRQTRKTVDKGGKMPGGWWRGG